MKYSLLLIFLLLTACSNDKATGPEEVKWDREACERCQMLISDRFHVTEIRGGENHQIHKFDDMGGAVLWLQEQPWKDNADTEIWVVDHHSGLWLNAKKAWYVEAEQTPMNYGFSAEAQKTKDALSFEEMRASILKRFDKRQ